MVRAEIGISTFSLPMPTWIIVPQTLVIKSPSWIHGDAPVASMTRSKASGPLVWTFNPFADLSAYSEEVSDLLRDEERKVSVAANCLANFSRSSCASIAKILSAPRALATAMQSKPTGPALLKISSIRSCKDRKNYLPKDGHILSIRRGLD